MNEEITKLRELAKRMRESARRADKNSDMNRELAKARLVDKKANELEQNGG